MKQFTVAKKKIIISTNSMWFKLNLKPFKKFEKAKTRNQTVRFGQKFPKLETGNSVSVWFQTEFESVSNQTSPTLTDGSGLFRDKSSATMTLHLLR